MEKNRAVSSECWSGDVLNEEVKVAVYNDWIGVQGISFRPWKLEVFHKLGEQLWGILDLD